MVDGSHAWECAHWGAQISFGQIVCDSAFNVDPTVDSANSLKNKEKSPMRQDQRLRPILTSGEEPKYHS
jgi:hypothetical protein